MTKEEIEKILNRIYDKGGQDNYDIMTENIDNEKESREIIKTEAENLFLKIEQMRSNYHL